MHSSWHVFCLFLVAPYVRCVGDEAVMISDFPKLRVLIVGASSDETAAVVAALVSGGYNVKSKCAFNVSSFERHL